MSQTYTDRLCACVCDLNPQSQKHVLYQPGHGNHGSRRTCPVLCLANLDTVSTVSTVSAVRQDTQVIPGVDGVATGEFFSATCGDLRPLRVRRDLTGRGVCHKAANRTIVIQVLHLCRPWSCSNQLKDHQLACSNQRLYTLCLSTERSERRTKPR